VYLGLAVHDDTMGFRNPVLPGCYPDPSVCRVGDDFYLVNSTFEWFPGLPVHHSRDLVHWRLIGHVLDRPEQLDLDGIRPSGGLFAPTIRHHGGRFYVVCTLVDGPTRSGHFVVHAESPDGPWSAPVWLDGAGFDPSLLFDDDGTVWFCACREADPLGAPGRTEVYLRRTDLAEGRPTGPEHVLWRGALADAVWAEGPHVYRVDGRYYLVAAEGGTARHHAVVVARSDHVTGPYVGSPDNPVLTHRQLGRAHPVAAVGHADLVDTPAGEWWAVLLAYRLSGGDLHNLGRETFLVPVTWEDGWPVWAPGTGQVLLDQPVSPALPECRWPDEPVRDDFDRPALGPVWQVLRTPRECWWSLTERPGHLRLRLRPESVADLAQPSLVARRQQHLDCWAATELDFTSASEHECAGLVVLQNNDFHLRLVVHGGQRRELRAVRRSAGTDALLGSAALPDGPVRLGVLAVGQDYDLRYTDVDGTWRTLATADGSVLSSEVAGGFTGAFLGPYASANGRASTSVADFDWFDYHAVTTVDPNDYRAGGGSAYPAG
jgi:alpha-N-arabinofuranosidase